MIKLIFNLIFIFIFTSCDVIIQNKNDQIRNNDINTSTEIKKENNTLVNSINLKSVNSINLKSVDNINLKTLNYVIGDPYFIEGVQYIPQEDYTYDEIGLASFYGKHLHNKRTLNNDLNKVTELLARHKTLPLPSVVKITNLDNGLSLIVKVNDRHNDNSSLIQVSRKTAQLLKFYKNKIAKVRIQILTDASKQQKVVTLSISDPFFNETIVASPTVKVSISDMEDNPDIVPKNEIILDPIKIGLEEVNNKDLYLKVYDFESYNVVKSLIADLDLSYKFITEKEKNSYNIILGPLENIEANNLVLSFISKGYKKTEFILK